MKIDAANQKDLPVILSLQKLAYISEAEIYQDHDLPPLAQTLGQIEEDFKQQVFLKAVIRGKIIGSVRGYLEDGTCYVGRLIVHPEHQNKGIGTSLMREIERQFPQTARYELFTGDKSERNLYLYQKLGYRIFKTQQLTDRVDLVYLEKWNS